MFKTRNVLAGVALAGILVAGGATAASASTSQTDFGGIMNSYQQSRYFATQTKANTGANASIRFSGLGGDSSANVKAQNVTTGTQYTEKKGLGEAYTYAIEDKTKSGQRTRLIVTNNAWVVVDVAISGWFKTN